MGAAIFGHWMCKSSLPVMPIGLYLSELKVTSCLWNVSKCGHALTYSTKALELWATCSFSSAWVMNSGCFPLCVRCAQELLRWLFRNHSFLAFLLYLAGLIAFVSSLVKKYYLRQFLLVCLRLRLPHRLLALPAGLLWLQLRLWLRITVLPVPISTTERLLCSTFCSSGFCTRDVLSDAYLSARPFARDPYCRLFVQLIRFPLSHCESECPLSSSLLNPDAPRGTRRTPILCVCPSTMYSM